MQVTETKSEGLSREFEVVVAASIIEGKIENKLRQLAGSVQLPGFRPGKVPPALIRKRFGPAVIGEVLEETVSETSRQAIEERGLRAATQPRVEITAFEERTDLKFNLAVEVMPEMPAIDYDALTLERLKAEPAEEDVTKALERLAGEMRRSEPVAETRPAASGDIVVIDFKGTVDGEAFQGGTGSDFELELGSNTFIPGFEDQLVGAEAGQTRSVDVTFPADYPKAELAGKAAVFETTVKALRRPVATPVDDELAKMYGMDSLDALKETVKRQLANDFAAAARIRLKRALLDALAERYRFPVPEGMVEEEFQSIWRQVKGEAEHDHDHDHDHDHAHHDHDHGDHPGHGDHHGHAHGHGGHDHGHDHGHHGHESAGGDHAHAPASPEEEKERAEYRAIADRRVRLALLLSEVGRLNNIQVGEEEIRRRMAEEASRFPGQERQVMEYFQKAPGAIERIRAPIYEDKVVDFIVEMAKVTDRTVSAEELFREDEDEPAPAAGA